MLCDCVTSILSCSSTESSFTGGDLGSDPTMGEAQLGSVKVEDSVGERVTGFVNFRE